MTTEGVSVIGIVYYLLLLLRLHYQLSNELKGSWRDSTSEKQSIKSYGKLESYHQSQLWGHLKRMGGWSLLGSTKTVETISTSPLYHEQEYRQKNENKKFTFIYIPVYASRAGR